MDLQNKLNQLIDALNQVLLGKSQQVKLSVTCILAGGHLLIEDLPGMGKTTLSHALAMAFGLDYRRVQFTSDMLPADLLGISIFEQDKGQFRFHKGPVFSQLLLADEINRSNPKTQSALLEAMEEKQVTVDGESYPLPSPFFVIATQNPVHQNGTYPLPESQLDRFLMRIQIGFPPKEAELALLNNGKGSRLGVFETPLISTDMLMRLQAEVHDVELSDAAAEYVLRLLHHSREANAYPNPLSPRAGLAVVSAAKAYSFIDNRNYVTPDDIKAVFEAVTEHRLRSGHGGNMNTRYSQQILQNVSPL